MRPTERSGGTETGKADNRPPRLWTGADDRAEASLSKVSRQLTFNLFQKSVNHRFYAHNKTSPRDSPVTVTVTGACF